MRKDIMDKDAAKKANRKCLRCNKPLDFSEGAICNECTDDMWHQKRRRNLFVHFFFQLGMLIFVYLYFYKGVFVIYRYLKG
jgi:predicted nucleic acid-binding Zn ribbon protein